MLFKNRKEAGRLLAGKLTKYKKRKNVLVLAIPRGGVVVGDEIAKELQVPLDVVIIKKIGCPGNEELAAGAAGPEGYYLNEEIAGGVPESYLKAQIKLKQKEAGERYEALRGKKKKLSRKNKIIILVDDGIATGSTVMMGMEILKKQGAKKVIVAVPVGPPSTVAKLRRLADEVICLEQPEFFMAIGEFYRDFTPVEDEEARRLLERANKL